MICEKVRRFFNTEMDFAAPNPDNPFLWFFPYRLGTPDEAQCLCLKTPSVSKGPPPFFPIPYDERKFSFQDRPPTPLTSSYDQWFFEVFFRFATLLFHEPILQLVAKGNTSPATDFTTLHRVYPDAQQDASRILGST